MNDETSSMILETLTKKTIKVVYCDGAYPDGREKLKTLTGTLAECDETHCKIIFDSGRSTVLRKADIKRATQRDEE